MRRKLLLLVVTALTASVLVASPAEAAPDTEAGPTVYVGELSAEQLRQVADLGLRMDAANDLDLSEGHSTWNTDLVAKVE